MEPTPETPDSAPSPGSLPWAAQRLATAVGGPVEPAVAAAFEYACRAHAGQTRIGRDGPAVPYFVHPVEVAVLAARFAATVEAPLPPLAVLLSAAILHDTVEDCSVSVDDLEARFGEEVTRLVLALSKPRLKEKESNEERADRFTRQIAAAGHAAVFLKCCDLMHNLAEMETTPTSVLRKAVQRGTTQYLPLLEQRPLGDAFRAAVTDALDRARSAVDRAEGRTTPQPLSRILGRLSGGKTEAHDAIQLLQEIDASGRAMVVKYPRGGAAVVVAGDLGTPLDAGRLEAIRSALRRQGGAARLRSSLLNARGAAAAVSLFGCLDRGFDRTDTLLLWVLPGGQSDPVLDGMPAELILRVVLSTAMRSSAELCRDLAVEAMEHGLQLDLSLLCDFGLERGQLGQLVRWRNTCEQACRLVEAEFGAFLQARGKKGTLWHRTRIESRVKTCASILAKFQGSARNAWPDFASLRDIAGIRVICPTEWHTGHIVAFLEESRGERPLDGRIERYDLEPTVHGYRGVHAVRQVRVPGEPRLIPCEVQIRTMMQDAWSTLSHTVAYKAVRKTKPRQRAALRALAAALAECDKAAAAIFHVDEE